MTRVSKTEHMDGYMKNKKKEKLTDKWKKMNTETKTKQGNMLQFWPSYYPNYRKF